MDKERPNFMEDESKWVLADIDELAHSGNAFAYLKNKLHGSTDPQNILYAANSIFELPQRETRWEYFPPIGGTYDTPQGRDITKVANILREEVFAGRSFPHTEYINPQLHIGHACARIESLITEHTVGGWHAASVKTYVFLTNKGERQGDYVVFSMISEKLGRFEEQSFIQGFADPRLYSQTPVVNLIVPQTIEQ